MSGFPVFSCYVFPVTSCHTAIAALLLHQQSSLPFKYILTDNPKKSKPNGKDKDSKGEKEKTKAEECVEAVRDLKISWLSK